MRYAVRFGAFCLLSSTTSFAISSAFLPPPSFVRSLARLAAREIRARTKGHLYRVQ
ncbi:unnamed protein product [Amoebophrya sp. A25]|nr:unnamed protein product [Amoebophrya sp. A25]|eukprot:GSA25T00006896001.1